MEPVQNYKSAAGRRRGYFYPCGTEALMGDLVEHRPSRRQAIVWSINQGGKIRIRWSDIPIGVHPHGQKMIANVNVGNVRFVKRNARLGEERAA